MLIHITPKLYLPIKRPGEVLYLLDITIPQFGLTLVGEKDVTVRRPFPNKAYQVACRKIGQKAVAGILIETKGVPGTFTATTRWSIFGERVLTHEVNYQLAETELDAASDQMLLWYEYAANLGNWSKRIPDECRGLTPSKAQPRMDFFNISSKESQREGNIVDTHDNDFISKRVESFKMPTIEAERLFTSDVCGAALPMMNSVFKANIN